VAYYDLVMVMDRGTVAEFGEPSELLRRESIFKDMCVASGEYEEILRLARDAELHRSQAKSPLNSKEAFSTE